MAWRIETTPLFFFDGSEKLEFAEGLRRRASFRLVRGYNPFLLFLILFLHVIEGMEAFSSFFPADFLDRSEPSRTGLDNLNEIYSVGTPSSQSLGTASTKRSQIMVKHALTLFTDFAAGFVRILIIMLKTASEKDEK
ncbi:hypothetical protein HHK36_018923 [Tetracentron sinense]|uniref:Uncharacterized protein n=1 Tax=Tetracentron sinense TaxID=13715 RepID=A0A835DCB2_TETSI|nr:hypothetical protein HHK36_018923 [Tetracentron sinense]